MEHQSVPVTPLLSRAAKLRRLLARVLVAAIGVLLMLALDFSPTVPTAKPPTADQARRVRDFMQAMRMQLRSNNGFAEMRLDREDLTSATTLVSALGKFGRVSGGIEQKALIVRISRQIGIIWLNGEARILTSSKGFPETHLKIGALPLGRTISRWIIDLATGIARTRGVEVPPIDDLVQSVDVQATTASVHFHLPLGGAFANDLSNFRAQPVDATHAAMIYCRLTKLDKKMPATDLAVVVRRAFQPSSSTLAIVEQNRSALVALAMYAVSPDAGRLAGDATQRVAKCRRPNGLPLLSGRADLAHHWTLSAALSVSLGDDVGRAMGEWKELSDSRAGGTGFSFVDLAADRAGLAIARRATNPATAAATAKRLQSADSERLLPIRALALSEGLSEQTFVAGFKSIDSAQFAEAKSRIDRVLTKTIGDQP
jgi:uncharacterized protein YfiM (DUF2279 family)